jgi:ATP/maltotriose-dependent transcriptional regulator MalT
VYLDAAGNVRKLDELIKCGEQQILICGDSGSGKSALIANWIAQHQQADPEDQIHAHHLGFTNDANTLRPLLARLIESASALLLADELISEAPKIPEDWWELVAQVATTLVDVGRWARRQGRRWILVLDGIDRLPDEDQNALAWLPPIIPADVQVVVSALPCKLRELLLQRNFTTLAIGPLQQAEQEALIERYLVCRPGDLRAKSLELLQD